jgi:hypothetical protein
MRVGAPAHPAGDDACAIADRTDHLRVLVHGGRPGVVVARALCVVNGTPVGAVFGRISRATTAPASTVTMEYSAARPKCRLMVCPSSVTIAIFTTTSLFFARVGPRSTGLRPETASCLRGLHRCRSALVYSPMARSCFWHVYLWLGCPRTQGR